MYKDHFLKKNRDDFKDLHRLYLVFKSFIFFFYDQNQIL
jgi:hypothetical protein